eukprot:CAMPEP_0117613562 /NCGR_PEP_ID=MMETSP0784-20121206/83539_1 /TAXON_ID=39447 /ORGANISM="" /LENGTH=326 /DNA_ID=CAMNT_0005417173 /DNA_START=73 /DNA_END=1050 /DNA_ORIENTATION=+
MEVRESLGRGRGVFATQRFAEGEVLVLERCLLALPNSTAIDAALHALFPRCHDDVPAWLYGWPLGMFPLGRAGLTYLKLQLNCYWKGIFAFGAQFNHSCRPSAARFIWDDGWSVVLSLEPLEVGDEVTVCYGFIDKPRWWRRLALLWKYGFRCNCRRCAHCERLPPHLEHLCRGYASVEDVHVEQPLPGRLLGCCRLIEYVVAEQPFECEPTPERALHVASAALAILGKTFPAAATVGQQAAKTLVEARVSLACRQATLAEYDGAYDDNDFSSAAGITSEWATCAQTLICAETVSAVVQAMTAAEATSGARGSGLASAAEGFAQGG